MSQEVISRQHITDTARCSSWKILATRRYTKTQEDVWFVPVYTLDGSAATFSSSSCAQMLWHVDVCLRACIFTVWAWMHVSAAESVNMHALQLPHSMNSLSLEQESEGLCESVCVATPSCTLNADLSIKADLACVLSADMPVINTWFHWASKGTAQPLGQMDGDTRACAHKL